jgi:hypothetical protein
MLCQHCRLATASWLDEYTDRAVCNRCCPSREQAYGMAFVRVLTHADAVRLAERDEQDQAARGEQR